MNTLQEYLKSGAQEMGLVLDSAQIEAFTTFADELTRWNRKINLTAITRVEDIAVKHFLDSLSLLAKLDLSGELLDLGSGAGFPSIPLKVVSPSIKLVSVDSVEKKILFQRHVVRLLGLDNFKALHARAETLPLHFPEKFDRIVSRAFSDIPKFVRLALPLLSTAGYVIAMKGREGSSEAEASADELARLGAEVSTIHEFELPFSNEVRSLIIIKRKTG
jgi:16S rRNA (guanine527-N7)-methyltransferase